MATLAELEKKVLDLSESDRISLVIRFLESSESSEFAEVNILWKDEILRRIERLDKGLSERIPASEVFKELDQRMA